MYDIGKPVIIDVAGTIKELVKWALTEILWVIGIILFALSAPFIYTIGAEYLAWRFPQYAGYWAVIYLFTAPIACTIWMLLIAPFGFDRQNKKWTFVRRHARYVGFMVSGFFGSILAEVVMMVVLMHIWSGGGNRHLLLIFAVAPFVVFSPVVLVLLSRWIRRNEYATA